jgi:membrane dipeptidase
VRNNKTHYIIFLFLLSFIFLIKDSFSQTDYKTLHSNSIVTDAHNDVLLDVMRGKDISIRSSTGHSDLIRFKEGGVDLQVFSVWMGPDYGMGKAFNQANQMIDSLESIIERNPDKIALVRNDEEAYEVISQNKIAAVIGVEGGHPIEDNLEYLEKLFDRGMRYMTLTWNNSTSWATSAMDETENISKLSHVGLTDFGREVVKKMNQLGIMIDLSHVGEKTFYDVIEVSTDPVIVSHSSVYSIAPNFRNLKDNQIKAIAKNGGVICINFYSGFLDSSYERKESEIKVRNKHFIDSLRNAYTDEDHADGIIDSLLANEYEAIRPPLSLLIDHIDYVVKLAGINYVGLGSDFDGISSLPKELDDVSFLPNITKELLNRGYSEVDIKKILGGNFMRVFSRVSGKK